MHPGSHQGSNMGELIRTAVQRGGDSIAFVHGEDTVTYRQLGESISRLVQVLTQRGLGKGDTVAALSGNRPQAFVVTAAGYMMGLRVLWVNPTSSEDDHAYMLDDGEVRTLFVDTERFSERAAALSRRVPGIRQIYAITPGGPYEDIFAAAAQLQPAPLLPQGDPDDVCTLVYTGGTTGKPKGVMHTHRVQVTMVMMELGDWDWPQETRFLATTPITHAAGAIIVPVLLRSGTFYMHHGFSPDVFIDLVEKHRITGTFLVPTMLYVLLDHPRCASADLSSLKQVIYGAAPMTPARLKEGLQRLGQVFMQLYGQSEAPNTLTVLHQRDHDPDRYPERLASCGTPIVGNQIRLLDPDGREVPQGEVGEICVRGPLVMKGYWKKPEETEKAFQHGWLHTGDLARCDADGFLYIVDRSKDMIITGGFNVYPREVEDTLARHPAVANAAVIGVPDPKWGEAVKAVVVLRPGTSVTAEELIALVKEHKGSVHAPKSIAFADELPVTGLGKLDKKALRAQHAAQA